MNDYLICGVGSINDCIIVMLKSICCVIIFVDVLVVKTTVNINFIFGRQEKAAKTASRKKSKQSALKDFVAHRHC